MFKGIHYKTGHRIEMTSMQGTIGSIELQEAALKGSFPTIAPGLVDLQINGYRGMDFNTTPFTKEMVCNITRALWQEGVTSYFPTVITNGQDEIETAVRTISDACGGEQLIDLSIPGIHLEGPFISPCNGPRGAHNKAYVRAPDWSLVERWQEAASGKIKLITLSPEWPGSADFINRCAENGIVVSVGHTAASPEQIREAVDAGATMSTHLGNGAHLMLPRHPNYLWEQLAQDALWTCCIADGFHLPDSVLKVIFKVKGERAVLVSDAVYLCGMPPGTYDTHIGGNVTLTPEGRLHLSDQPNLLAGSAQMLTWGIQQLVNKKLCDFPAAWDMASIYPARSVGLQAKAGLEQGAPADFVLLTKTEVGFRILQTVKNGITVYQCETY